MGGWSELTTGNHGFVCCLNTRFTEGFLAGVEMPSQCHEHPVPGYPGACSSSDLARTEQGEQPRARWGGHMPCQSSHTIFSFTLMDLLSPVNQPAASLCVKAWKAEVTRVEKSPYGNVWGLLVPTAARASPLLPVSDSCVVQVSSTSGSVTSYLCYPATVSAPLTPEEQSLS